MNITIIQNLKVISHLHCKNDFYTIQRFYIFS